VAFGTAVLGMHKLEFWDLMLLLSFGLKLFGYLLLLYGDHHLEVFCFQVAINKMFHLKKKSV
jgi:hypothetical protein